MKLLSLIIIAACQPSLFISASPVPFKNSVEVVFTPQDLKHAADYTLWKIPVVKDNLKTTVKQKVLNRMLTKELQEANPNAGLYPPGSPYQINNNPNPMLNQMNRPPMPNQIINHPMYTNQMKPNPANTHVQMQLPIAKPIKAIQIDTVKANGIVNSILKGPSPTEELSFQVVGIQKEDEKNKEESDESEDDDEEDEEDDGKLGYSVPSRIKNGKHDFGVKYYEANSLAKKDPFYDK
ncbi:uncharacterized protein J8A68_004526 [[Candida] subhashii]|uniref:Uncharacterized protein n=1 Tax=[Candida] subhashii TaxID=561895 RepID=A0A8J5UFC8_9ASCO|nr:uncharacterized protein J8A68_004526 [[Candida] subhashii]KAG7661923.1 hypothetical protein J8A68_004526 [[Candida] subhashii]